MESIAINSRADLDALTGTQAHADFLAALQGTMWRLQKDDTAGTWVAVEENATLERFGYTRADFPQATPPALPVYVPPPAVDMQAEIVKAMDALFDTTAKSKNYDNRITCALRAGYPGPFQAEGIAFASWMDAQNAKAYLMLAEVQAGTRPMPATVDEALALLDPMVWP